MEREKARTGQPTLTGGHGASNAAVAVGGEGRNKLPKIQLPRQPCGERFRQENL